MAPFSIIKAMADKLSGREDKLAQLKRVVNYHRDQLRRISTTENNEEFVKVMNDFLDFMHKYEHREVYASFERSSDFLEYQQFFLPYILRLAWQMEEKTFADMMSQTLAPGQKLGDIQSVFTKRSYSRIQDALNIADLKDCQSYVMLGCGKVPSSLFYVHDWTDIPRIVGVDNNKQAVSLAQKIVEKFALKRISIVEGDAASFDLGSFDAIYWGQFCTPRIDVMKNIVRTAKEGCKIILREPFHTGSLGTQRVLPNLDPRLEILAESEDLAGRFMLKHYVLRLK